METDRKTPLIAYSSERKGRTGYGPSRADQSYRAAERSLVALIRDSGYPAVLLDEPELFKSEAAFSAILGRRPSEIIHLAFRNTEQLRVLSGAYNIAYFAWNFTVLRDAGLLQSNVVTNQVHMLGLMDEVWVPSEFSREVLVGHGLVNTFLVPAPVVGESLPGRLPPDEALGRIGSVPAYPLSVASGVPRAVNVARLDELAAPLRSLLPTGAASRPGGRVTLTVVDPWDRRENLFDAIGGFHLATQADPDRDTLIVKLVTAPGGSRAAGVYDTMMHVSDHAINVDLKNVLVIPEFLQQAEMTALYSVADFYLSATFCESFNRSLVEAMSFGALPITTLNTAMSDYIDAENAIVIRAERGMPPIVGMLGECAGRSFAIDHSTRFDIADALRRAFALGDGARRAMGDKAATDVLRLYGSEPTMRRVRERFDRVRARPPC